MKKAVTLKINEELLEEFRSFIRDKYSKYQKGLLSAEVEQAIKFWMDLHTKSHTNKLDPLPIASSYIATVWFQVKSYLLRNYYEVIEKGTLIPYAHLERAIANVRGSDKRTIAKWLDNFVKQNIIKIKNVTLSGPVYEVQ